jgi:hypothetical protein
MLRGMVALGHAFPILKTGVKNWGQTLEQRPELAIFELE